MTHELLILRHGKSDWDVDIDDFHRPLKDRGKRAAQRMGVWLLQQGLLPDLVVSSPAERAIVTAQKCCKAMGMGSDMIQQERRLYAAGLNKLLAVLRGCPERSRRVLLVGHNPGLEELLGYLVGGEISLPEDGKLLPTATLARLRLSREWAGLDAGCARLESLVRPSALPEKFPFPNPDSEEVRDRPAYYYTQSSVIPYRLREGRLEILLISSSKKKHWVVPKGIKDPGLSPQASAAKEAWEEAGVEGEVAEAAVGSYTYEKWGATCTVTVYPMEVTKMVPESEWTERHRGREWVSPEQAVQRVKQEELKPLVGNLTASLEQHRS